MSSKFFTNKDGNTLENRLKDILKNYDIKYLEFLIGYFRMSGFSKIAKLLNGIKKARILVGINVDELTLEAKERGEELNLFNKKEKIKDKFIKTQANLIQSKDTPYSEEIEESINILANLISQKKVEIRISENRNIHSKIYILREEEKFRYDRSIDYKGSVITGSSNLTANGLKNNYEFNVELRDSDDIEFALKEFNSLWKNAVEIDESVVEKVKNKTYLRNVTPYELYLKFLAEYFDDRIENDLTILDILPKGFMKLAYQLDAVNEGIAKIKKHNGFFLSDVVGLGKTITATMIVKKLLFEIKGEVLVIAPPAIQREWKETFKKFEIGTIRNYNIISYGKLEDIDPSNYELIIIDEAHKFRNFKTSRYKELEKICKEKSKYRKKVILISATPLNNKPSDIANQIYLFQNKRNSTITSFPNLEIFFNRIEKEYNEIIKLNEEFNEEKKEKLKQLARKIRDNILREIMVRRTRSDILNNPMYREDLEKQGLTIPNVNPIKEIKYLMDDEMVKIFDETVDILLNKLQYERYKIISYIKPEKRKKFGKVNKNIFEENSTQLARIMQVFFVKRFESSFYAFKESLKRFEEGLKSLIEMFEKDDIFIGMNIKKIEDLLEDEDPEEKIEKFIKEGKIKRFKREDFQSDYLEKLKKELEIIQYLNDKWKDIKTDPKLEKLKKLFSQNKGKKIVIFTESKDTALYLANSLSKFKVLCVTSENRDRLKEIIRENFDANYPVKKQKNDYDIIITTDTLSEGVNLHRSNIIYNYDIPWNSTILMQRIGRVNRIGSKHKEIYIYNFVPSAKTDELIELSKKAFIKLQTFHSTLGEDNKIFSQQEEVESVGLFEISDEVDEELTYLEEIREFKKNNPKKFKEILNLPKKIRVQRKGDFNKTFVFIKNEKAKSYYLVTENEIKTINFLEMAKHLKADKNEKSLPITKSHYNAVKKALREYEKEFMETISENQRQKIIDKQDKNALQNLKVLRKREDITPEDYELFENSIKSGRYQNLSRDINKIIKGKVNIKEKLEKLKNEYNLQVENQEKEFIFRPEVVLSESFM
jgi:superfamily II DNA/RNA helicase